MADLKHVLTFIRLVKSKVRQKSANCLTFLQFLEPVSMLKSPAMMLSNFDRNYFADWVVFSKNSSRLLGGLWANEIPHFLFLKSLRQPSQNILIKNSTCTS